MAGGDGRGPPSRFNAPLETTLLRLAAFLKPCHDPWSIFGGAALHLHGCWCDPVADVDVLVSTGDALRIAAAAGLGGNTKGASDLFRSRLLLHPKLGAVDVEIMGGFEIFSDGRWHEVVVRQREELRYGAATTFVASLDDLEATLRLSGRDKDLRRLRLVDDLRRRSP